MRSPMTRREVLSKAVPAAALAATATSTIALGASSGRRQPASIPILRRDYWDNVVARVAGYHEVVCCTPAERDALLDERPEMVNWHWFDFGDRFVGESPYRSTHPFDRTNEATSEFAKEWVARAEYVKRQRELNLPILA